MRYIGSKEKILPFIVETITDIIGDIQDLTIADLFCGTTAVSKELKSMGCKLITNDYMEFSYAFQMAYIHNNAVPRFHGLEESLHLNGYDDVLYYLNNIRGIRGFFYTEYTLEGTENSSYKRNYFGEQNAERIDAIRMKIEEWYRLGTINNDEYNILLASLIDAVTKVSNISGTYGAFLKYDEQRKFKKLKLEPITFIESDLQHECYCRDIFDIIHEVHGDVLYLDPPYNTRLYPPYYHILETVTLYDNPDVYGLTGRRPYTDKLSPFCYKNKVRDAFDYIIRNANFQHIFISYSTEGLLPKDELQDLLSVYGNVQVFEESHRRFKSHNFGENHRNIKELIYYVRKY